MQSIYNQTAFNHISEVLVIVDGNSMPADILKKIANPKLKLSYSPKREGQSARLNDIFKLAKGDLVILTNDDVILENDALEKLINKWRRTGAGLLAGRVLPLPARNYIESILEIPNAITNKIIEKKPTSYVACNGRLMALSSALVKSLELPRELKNNDAFIYISSSIKNIGFCYVPEAICYFRNPGNLREYFRQSFRFQSSLADNARFFRSDIAPYYKISGFLFFKIFLSVLMRHPIRAVSYVLINLGGRVLLRLEPTPIVNDSGVWETDESTKEVGHRT